MAVFLLDSSALVKRYVSETGTAWLNGLLDPGTGNSIVLVRIAGVEVTAAITRKSRGGGLPAASSAAALAQFHSEFGTGVFNIIEVDEPLIDRAMRIAARHGLRGYDAVQMAGVLEVNDACQTAGVTMSLVSADVELNTAAESEGISVENPNDYP